LIAGLSSSASAGPIGWTSGLCALDFGAFAGFLGVLGFFAMGRIWDESGVQKRAFGTCALLCQQVSARPKPDAIMAFGASASPIVIASQRVARTRAR
jgi:hypothetical protein